MVVNFINEQIYYENMCAKKNYTLVYFLRSENLMPQDHMFTNK
jgi:hypothetical protein